MNTRFIAERYAPRSWMIRDAKTGRIVSYPGPSLQSVARAWLCWEAGTDGQRIGGLAEFSAVVKDAEERIAAALVVTNGNK